MKAKECNRCNTIKTISQFYPNKKMKDGHSNICKECSSTQAKHSYNEQKKKLARNTYLHKVYNLTQNDYNDLLLKQNNKCLICGENQSKFTKAFAVDHNHVTGTIRGLLCQSCNTGIGLFKDNPSILYKAIQYLYKNNTKEIVNGCVISEN